MEKIEGLDANKGLQLAGGTVEYYYEILATFYDDWLEREKAIENCLDEEDFSGYTTNVHALKGASANIGANKLSEAAYALEMAGQREDLEFITENTDNTMMVLRQLLADINTVLSSREAGSGEADSIIEAGWFKEELIKLKSALEVFDFEKINRTIDVLIASAQSNRHRTAVRTVSKHILMFEYDEAGELVESLLANLN